MLWSRLIRRTGGPGRVAKAALVAGTLSGLPSTLLALARGTSPLAATRAAGALAGRSSLRRGALVHAAVSLGWTAVLAAALGSRPPRPTIETLLLGLAAGSGIAVVDLGLIGRRVPEIAALRPGDQVLDHLLFGVMAVAALERA